MDLVVGLALRMTVSMASTAVPASRMGTNTMMAMALTRTTSTTRATVRSAPPRGRKKNHDDVSPSFIAMRVGRGPGLHWVKRSNWPFGSDICLNPGAARQRFIATERGARRRLRMRGSSRRDQRERDRRCGHTRGDATKLHMRRGVRRPGGDTPVGGVAFSACVWAG